MRAVLVVSVSVRRPGNPGGARRSDSVGLQSDVEIGNDGRDGERFDDISGVSHYDAALSAGGFTAYVSVSDEAVHLMNMDGRIVHTWSLPAGVLRERYGADVVPDESLGWRSLHVYPNGDLLVVTGRNNHSPYGFALVKLDKDSRLLWANFGNAHHDVTVGEDGLIYTIGQAIRQDAVAGLNSLRPPFLEDFVLVISADGKTIRRLSVMEAFVGTPYESSVKQLAQVRDWKGDYFHVNDIEPYDSRNRAPVVHEHQVLVSIRNMDALATIDLDTGKVVWLLQGTWVRQHDPDIVDGHIMLFDNRGDFSRGSRSRILEIDPLTQQITWQANAGDGYDLYSGWAGNQQVLDNGNVFITETVPGRLLELTRDGKVVWMYQVSGRIPGGKYSPPMLEARRYPAEYVKFELDKP